MNHLTRERCGMCHKISSVGFFVPNGVWAQAVHQHWRDSILCLACFTTMADEKMIEWEREIEFFPVSLRTHLEGVGWQWSPRAMVSLADVALAVAEYDPRSCKISLMDYIVCRTAEPQEAPDADAE